MSISTSSPAQILAMTRSAILQQGSVHIQIRGTVNGTNAIYSSNPLERHFRDVHVVVQHNAAFRTHYEQAGKALMGLRPTDPGW